MLNATNAEADSTCGTAFGALRFSRFDIVSDFELRASDFAGRPAAIPYIRRLYTEAGRFLGRAPSFGRPNGHVRKTAIIGIIGEF